MKEQGFKIPDDYFQAKVKSLQEIAQTVESEKPELSSPPKSNKAWYWLSAAAALILAFFLFPNEQNRDANISFSDLQEEQVIEFLNEDPNALHPEVFLEIPLEISDELSDFEELEILDESAIENYLNDHTIEYL